MSLLLDLLLAGSGIATGVGVALIIVALAVLLWLAVSGSRRWAAVPVPKTARTVEAPPVRRHRHPTARFHAQTVVRPAAVDEQTVVMPVLRDQTELIPTIGGGRRG